MLKQKHINSPIYSVYSQLRSYISIFKNVNILKYHTFQAFLKRFSEGYVSKISKILEELEISKFISEADDPI